MDNSYNPQNPWNQDVEGEAVLLLINSDANNIRVQAGPGAGKTYGLKRRVLRLVHPDGLGLAAHEILIVAFNRVIAQDLKDDIEQYLTNAGYNGPAPVIRTVHALCLQAIGGSVRLLLPHEREAMLYDVLELHPELKTDFTRHSHAEQALRDHEAKHEQHPALWQAVDQWLNRHNARLLSDLPGLLLDSLQLGHYEGAVYEHVIVDEFQDLTPGEQALFVKLRKPTGSLLALGDSKQSIYRFRGNDLEGLSKLEQLSPGSEVLDIAIPQCRRCPEAIVEAANTLMVLSPPALEPGNKSPANIHLVQWNTYQEEAKGLAKHIVDNIHAHPDESHLAMVTRRRFGYLLRDEIKELDDHLSVDLSFSESMLETWPVREAFLYFCAVFDPDPPSWRAWFAYRDSPPSDNVEPPKRNAPAYLKFFEACGDDIGLDAIKQLAAERRTKPRGQGGSTLWDRANRFVTLNNQLAVDSDPRIALEQLFNPAFWNPGGGPTAALDLKLLQSSSLSLLDELLEINPDTPPDQLMSEIAKRLRYMIATREAFEPQEKRHLQITTLWGAKGVTANHVYILGLADAAIPGEKRPEYPGTDDEFLQEQRRLFYVSLTRSTNTLLLSRATGITSGEAKQLNLAVSRSRWRVPLPPSRFLRDIIDVLPEAIQGDIWNGC